MQRPGKAAPGPGRAPEEDAAEAFGRCFRSCHAELHAFVARRIGAVAAEDVVAETFATVWQRWADIPRDLDGRRAWVFGVARNKLRDARRSAARRDRLTVRAALTSREETDDPAESLVAAGQVQDLLADLPRAERDAMLLTVVAGLTCTEAAEVLACSVSAMTSRVSRARARLRGLVAEDGSERRGADRRASHDSGS
jgi:RNA polymerase sigma-70 factor, ECF subfamily